MGHKERARFLIGSLVCRQQGCYVATVSGRPRITAAVRLETSADPGRALHSAYSFGQINRVDNEVHLLGRSALERRQQQLNAVQPYISGTMGHPDCSDCT
jgi:hypothetical protein